MVLNLAELQNRLANLEFTPEASSYLEEIQKNLRQDFKPFQGGYFAPETMDAILNLAATKLINQLSAVPSPVNFQDLRDAWTAVLVDFHTNKNWGFESQKEKPRAVLSEDQKIFRELLPYFGFILIVATIIKTAFFYYGMHMASNPTDENKSGMVITMTILFVSMILFAWKKYR